MTNMSPILEYAKQFLLQRVFMYGLIILGGLFVVSPLGSLQTSFNEKCLLYADIRYNTTVDHHYFKIRFGATSICDYDLAVAVIFCIFYPAITIAANIFLFFRQKADKKVDLSHYLFLANCIVDDIICILVLVMASTISAGFVHLCDQIVMGERQGVRSCSDAQRFQDWRGFDGSNFYLDLSIATAGSWFCFIFWLLQSLFGMWKLWRLNMLPTLPEQLRCCKDS